MLDRKDIEKLAALSRLRLNDGEAERLEKEFEQILGYISTITTATIPEGVGPEYSVENVMRSDGPAHESSAFTDALLANAPQRRDQHIAVKKILG